jgi:hypothetical protein
VFVSQFVSDTFVRVADELGEWSVWPTAAARERWDEAADRGPWVTIEGSKIDRLCCAACWTAHPKEPVPRLKSAADRRREQHRHALGLALIPCRYQATGVFEHLCLSRTPRGRFLLGRCSSPGLHLAAVESHDVDFGYCLSLAFVACSRTPDVIQEKIHGD